MQLDQDGVLEAVGDVLTEGLKHQRAEIAKELAAIHARLAALPDPEPGKPGDPGPPGPPGGPGLDGTSLTPCGKWEACLLYTSPSPRD